MRILQVPVCRQNLRLHFVSLKTKNADASRVAWSVPSIFGPLRFLAYAAHADSQELVSISEHSAAWLQTAAWPGRDDVQIIPAHFRIFTDFILAVVMRFHNRSPQDLPVSQGQTNAALVAQSL